MDAEGGGEQLEEVAAALRSQLSLVEGHEPRRQLGGQQALRRTAAHAHGGLRIIPYTLSQRATRTELGHSQLRRAPPNTEKPWV